MGTKFIDLHVHSIFSKGVDTPMRLAFHARELGVEIGLCDSHKFDREILTGSLVASGYELTAKTKRDFKEELRSLRNEWDYVVVPGGEDIINRLAVGDNRVDVLLHPDLGRKDNGIDTFIAREARKNEVAIGVNLGGLIAAKGGYRINLCKNIQRNLELSRKYGFSLIACTGARSRYDLRTGECMFGLLVRLGFTEEEVVEALYEVPKMILGGSR
jgi:RNase P/RNase MRP subunit p30